MKVIVLIGLPGSGKSSWGRKFEKENSNCKHIEFDKCCILEPIYFTFEDAIKGEIEKNTQYDTVILDFIFHTTNHIETIINSCDNGKIDKIELHYWETNIEQCLINDNTRMITENRKYDCSYAIKNRQIEIEELGYFQDKYKNIEFSIANHKVFNGGSNKSTLKDY